MNTTVTPVDPTQILQTSQRVTSGQNQPLQIITPDAAQAIVPGTVQQLNGADGTQAPQAVRKVATFKPKKVSAEIQRFIQDRYGDSIPAAGAFFPAGSAQVDPNMASYNRRDRVKVFYQSMADYFKQNPAADGNEVMDKIGHFMVGVENIAYTKADIDTPTAPAGQVFRTDPKYMLVRDQGAKHWAFKWEGGRLKPFTQSDAIRDRQLTKPSGLWGAPTFNLDQQHKDTIRFIPSTGEYTLVSGNGAITVMRPKGDGTKLPDDGGVRFKPYDDAQAGNIPDLSQMTTIVRIPGKDGKDVFGQVLPEAEIADEWKFQKTKKPLDLSA